MTDEYAAVKTATMKMMFRPFAIVVFIAMTVIAEENCTSHEISTSIDQSRTDMKVEEQYFVINAVTNATLKGGSDNDIVRNIWRGLNPHYNKERIWTVIEEPANTKFWCTAKISVTACLCDNCKKYYVVYLKP